MENGHGRTAVDNELAITVMDILLGRTGEDNALARTVKGM